MVEQSDHLSEKNGQVDEIKSKNLKETVREPFSWGKTFLLLLLLSVLILIGSAAWLQMTTGFFTSFSQSNSLNSEITALQKVVEQQGKQISVNQSVIEQINQTGNQPSDSWLLAESDNLIQFAKVTLTVERNIPATIQLLEMAQSHLQKINSSMSEEIVSMLAQDITQLKSVPNVDISKLYLALQKLSESASSLPLLSEEVKPDNKQISEKNSKDQPFWQRGLSASFDLLKSLVVIRHRDQDVQPLISMEQKQLVILNIQNLFEQAQFGLLHQEQLVYEASLKQIQKLVERYFFQTNQTTTAFLKELQTLSQLNISSALPDLTKPLIVMQSYHRATIKQTAGKTT